MNYVELTVSVATRDAERIADVVRAQTGVGVAIEFPFLQPTPEHDAEIRDDGHALIRAYLRSSTAIDALTTAISAAGVDATIEHRCVADEDWAESWKQHFHVERFGRIVVVPSWREYAAQPDDVIVTLDPGMAFGTGQHETTRMCLEALDRHVHPAAAVLDAGCGSGILAIAAAKLGARRVLAIDIDPDCVRITGDNAGSNSVAAIVEARIVSGDESVPDAETFDLIVANIIASTIIRLAPAFAGALAPGGRLIASGIIAERQQEVVAKLAACGLRIDAIHALGEWRAVEAIPATPLR